MTHSRLPGWLVGLFVATLALGTDEFVIAGLLPELATDLQISAGTTGQLISVFALTFAIGAPVMAVVLDPYPRRRVILTALAVFMAANIAAAIAPTFSALFVLRAVAGLAAAVVSSTAFAVAAQGAPPARQGRYLSVVTAGLTVALFTGVPVGAWVGALFGWRSTFIVIAIVALGALIALALGLPHLEGAPAAGLGERLSPLRDARVLRLVLAVFLSGAGGLMFYSYLAALLDQYQGHAEDLPLVLLLVGLIGVPSAFLGGRLADRHGGRRSRLIVVGGHAIALAIAGALLTLDAPFPLLLLGIAAWSAFAWALNPPLQASTIEAAPEAPMTAISLNISGLYLGTAAAAGIGGMIVDGPGALWIPFAAAIALTLAWASASFRAPQPAKAAA
ncbi:MAG: MFS transporter [Streptomyces sp.]|jgi:predicted MFS family arabinose efflux permease|nr:MFS transporter [Streptomyces sp.]